MLLRRAFSVSRASQGLAWRERLGRGCTALERASTVSSILRRHADVIGRQMVREASTSRAHVALGTVASGAGVAVYLLRAESSAKAQEIEEAELALVPEPPAHFAHPYADWPWYHQAWFALKRSMFLTWVFAPFMWASTLVLLDPNNMLLRERWLEKMLCCTQAAGCAFQKFGQWLSMRPDMFPPDVIEVLAKLRSDAPSHSPDVSRQMLESELGHNVEDLFAEFEDKPVASGSVGQVHRAVLHPEYALDGSNGKLRKVAVKVRHPGVVDSAFMDLNIIWKVVDFSQRFLHMTLPFSREEFDEVIQAQLDFTREAFNLQKFSRNFKEERSKIQFPRVSSKLVTPGVIVETWADGRVISNILEDFDNATESCKNSVSASLEKKREVQSRLCHILYDMSMKMMVRDNFVHGDLHGGNILYSEEDDHVTVIDCGIATHLKKATFAPFGAFLHALCSGDVDNTVKYLQNFNVSDAPLKMDEFKADIKRTFDKFMGPLRQHPELPVNAADMFGEVLFSMQRYRMQLQGDVASTLFTITVSEGLVRQLDPAFDVATGALPYIVRHMSSMLIFQEGSWQAA